jgi:RNA polymerase sigma factor (TIGR02999 family)
MKGGNARDELSWAISRTIRAVAGDPGVTALLRDWRAGDNAALNRLVPLVEGELHRIATRLMRGERAGHSLQATALVNEAYIRLVDAQHVNWQDRAHFLAMAARLMRRVLVDYARSKGYQKRGGDAVHVTFDELQIGGTTPAPDLIALDDALSALARVDARKAKVVELRFYGGLNVEEVANVLAMSPETVMRDWKFAKTWLLRELKHAGRGD